jgi:hypothetical protein
MSTPKTSVTVASTVDLAPDMPGYQLRLRNVVFEPGGAIGVQRHPGRDTDGGPGGRRRAGVYPWQGHHRVA